MQVNTKKDLREKVLTLLRSQEEEKRLEKSSAIKFKLFSMDEFKHSSHILFYASFNGEVNTTDMIREALELGKTIGLPLIEKESNSLIPRIINNFESDLDTGPYGIKQPRKTDDNEMTRIDMVIVPGLAFDLDKNRLGRGAGYYDRFLSSLSKDVVSVGLAFDFQIFNSLPQKEEHDFPLTHILSN